MHDDNANQHLVGTDRKTAGVAGPTLSRPMVEALAAAAAKGPEGFADGLDEALAAAFREALRGTLAEAYSAWAKLGKQPGTVWHRSVGILT